MMEEGVAKLINCSKLKNLNSSHKNLIIEYTIALAQAAYVEKQASALYSLQKSLFFLI